MCVNIAQTCHYQASLIRQHFCALHLHFSSQNRQSWLPARNQYNAKTSTIASCSALSCHDRQISCLISWESRIWGSAMLCLDLFSWRIVWCVSFICDRPRTVHKTMDQQNRREQRGEKNSFFCALIVLALNPDWLQLWIIRNALQQAQFLHFLLAFVTKSNTFAERRAC